MTVNTDEDFAFTITRTKFDENYLPSENTRLTTNFANLARGKRRRNNLKNTLHMISNRFNSLAHWDNPQADRYQVGLEIISVDIIVAGESSGFPSIELLKTVIVDQSTGVSTDGLAGNNFSSYLRDYDFNVLLPMHNQGRRDFSVPEKFGELHGAIFKCFVSSAAYQNNFAKPPVICLSVSQNKTYYRNDNHHPILGVEYVCEDTSLTEAYFRKMGLNVRYFMPSRSAAPLAFFFQGDLLNDYSPLELIGTISTMETFQKIYRPEIYNANTQAGQCYRPNIDHQDHSLTQVIYDREERNQLGILQGEYAQSHFMDRYQSFLSQHFNYPTN